MLPLQSLSPTTIVGASATLLILGLAINLIYNIYFHPNAKYKGPWLWAASDVPYALLQLRGTSHLSLKRAHDKYGPVVRIGPNALSYIQASAWDDIYGFRKGNRANLPKDPQFYNEMLLDKKTITMATDDDAVPIRRAINPAFSNKALLEQEPMMRRHVFSLLEEVEKSADRDGQVDMKKWFVMSMFDINSDFAFGEELGCVRSGKYHEWVQFVIDYFYAATLMHQCHKFWPLSELLSYMIPASLRAKKDAHNQSSLDRARRRIGMQGQTDRRDFMHHFLNQAHKENLKGDVIEAQASIVILAGSETSAVALTAALYYILKDPKIYEKVRAELHETFPHFENISLRDVMAKLPYLDAVVQETLRLSTPLANGFTRLVPAEREDHKICGETVAPNTVVTINHYCCNTSTENFRNPNTFVPERWLKDPEYEHDNRSVVQPFSVGPRNCPGKSFALYNINFILAHLLWQYDLELVDRSGDWSKNQKIFNGWVQPPLPIYLKRSA